MENFLSGVYVHDGVGEAVKRIVGYEAPLTQNPKRSGAPAQPDPAADGGAVLITPSPALRPSVRHRRAPGGRHRRDVLAAPGS